MLKINLTIDRQIDLYLLPGVKKKDGLKLYRYFFQVILKSRSKNKTIF